MSKETMKDDRKQYSLTHEKGLINFCKSRSADSAGQVLRLRSVLHYFLISQLIFLKNMKLFASSILRLHI